MASYLRPRRGKKATAINQKVILKRGEIFLECPDSGVGTGKGRIKVGDGITEYQYLPYFIDLDSAMVDVGTSNIQFTEASSALTYTELLNLFASGDSVKTIFGIIKRTLRKLITDVGNKAEKDHTHDNYLVKSQVISANYVYASPSGNSGITQFRKLTVADLPTGTSATTVALGNHTHNYAGSTSAGGAANSASRLNTNTQTGSSTKPVYFSSAGLPVACSKSLGDAAEKGVAENVSSGNGNLVTSAAVYDALCNPISDYKEYDESDNFYFYRNNTSGSNDGQVAIITGSNKIILGKLYIINIKAVVKNNFVGNLDAFVISDFWTKIVGEDYSNFVIPKFGCVYSIIAITSIPSSAGESESESLDGSLIGTVKVTNNGYVHTQLRSSHFHIGDILQVSIILIHK